MLFGPLPFGLVQPSPGLPTVAHVEQWFVAALGGQKAIMRPKSMAIGAEYVVYGRDGKPQSYSMRILNAPFKQSTVVFVPTVGQFQSGYDGKVGWTLRPHSGPVLQSGTDLASARRDADMYYWAHVPAYFRTMKVVGQETFHGNLCYHIVGVTKWGKTNNQFYDVRTHLLDGYAFHDTSATGKGEDSALTEQVFSDYKSFSGLKIPMSMTAFQGGKLVTAVKYRSLSFDDVPKSAFDLPAAVKKAIKSGRPH